MGLALLIVLWLITLISSYFFIAKTWWLPVGASTAAAGIDHYFTVTFILMGVVFVAAQGILGLFVWKYRAGGSSSDARYSHGNNRLELAWTALTLVLFVGESDELDLGV
jgi:heme/copper-type cytochrome/quinol oxidase subunit 2